MDKRFRMWSTRSGCRFRHAASACRGRVRAAFTLVELLLVAAILGILSAVVIPNISAFLGSNRSTTAIRVLTQMGRYARSMALLNQTPVELVLDLDTRKISVDAATPTNTLASVSSEDAFYEMGAGTAVAASFGRAVSIADKKSSDRLLERNKPQTPDSTSDDFFGTSDSGESSASAGTGNALADSIHMERDLPELPVVIEFLGYADNVERNRFRTNRSAASAGTVTNGVFRIRYRTNGTCRPYKLGISLEGAQTPVVLFVDAVGTPRVQYPDEDNDRGSRQRRRKW